MSALQNNTRFWSAAFGAHQPLDPYRDSPYTRAIRQGCAMRALFMLEYMTRRGCRMSRHLPLR